MIEGDSNDYHIIIEAIQEIKDIDGLTCEIGLRRGLGSYYIVETLVKTGQKKTHISIDPFGNIDYSLKENIKTKMDYTNEMRDQCIIDLYSFTKEAKINFLFFPLEDTEFMERFSDGVPVYDEKKRTINSYAFVHFDGPHKLEPIINEFKFFNERAPVGAIFVFDDITGYYDHDLLEREYIFPNGWEFIKKTTVKASYKKIELGDIMKPRGGTELIVDNIRKYVKNIENINLIVSVCHPQLISVDKPNVLLQELSYDQENVALLSDPTFISAINKFVFVSHWQYEKFRNVFNIPEDRSVIIKNAIDPIEYKLRERAEKIKLIYTSTPWRGLNVLLKSFELLNRDDVELHIYSSVTIYGEAFANQMQNKYQPLFDKAESMENVIYHGYAPNEEVRKAVAESHIFAYPSIFEETSCISAIEAGAAGCSMVCTNFGALPETCADFATFVTHMNNYKKLAERYAETLNEVIDNYWNSENQEKIRKQSEYFNTYYNWDSRVPEWERLIEKIS